MKVKLSHQHSMFFAKLFQNKKIMQKKLEKEYGGKDEGDGFEVEEEKSEDSFRPNKAKFGTVTFDGNE